MYIRKARKGIADLELRIADQEISVARYGFYAVCVGYRLSGEARFSAALQDAKCAVRWVRRRCPELNVDPEKVAMWGASAASGAGPLEPTGHLVIAEVVYAHRYMGYRALGVR